MNEMAKKYLKTALTLGLIAGGSALLIGGTNALTAPRIEANAKKKLMGSLQGCFGEDVDIEDPENPKDWTKESPAPQYVNASWKASKNGQSVGTLYRARGIDAAGYGYITILVGVYDDSTLTNIVVLENGNTKPAEYESYIKSYNKADDKNVALEKVSPTGATFSSTLTMNMVKEAIQLSSGGISYTEDISENGLTAFSTAANMYQSVDISSYAVKYIKKAYTASLDSYENVVGTLFYTEAIVKEKPQGIYIAVDSNKKLANAAIYDANVDSQVSSFVESYNAISGDKSKGLAGIKSTCPQAYNAFYEVFQFANGKIKQEPKLGAFESGEVSAFEEVTCSGNYLTKAFKALKGEETIGYVYEITSIAEDYESVLKTYIGIYKDGSLGRLVFVSYEGEKGPTETNIKDFIAKWNSSSKEERKTLVDSTVTGASFSGPALQTGIKAAIEDQKGKEAN